MFNNKKIHYYRVYFFDDVSNKEFQCLYHGEISDAQTLRQALCLCYPKFAIKVIKINKLDFLFELKHHSLLFIEKNT